MPAIPAIIMAAGALGGAGISAYASKKASESAMQKTSAENSAFEASSQLAKDQNARGSQMFNTALPAVRQSLDYYGTLLNGNQAARQAITAPEAESIGNNFAGADRSVNQSYLQGGQRDIALAENARSKASAVARLTTGVRPMAAQNAAGIATGLMPGANANFAQAGNIYGNQQASEASNRATGAQAGGAASANYGKLFAQLMSVYGGKGGKGMPRSGGSPDGGNDRPAFGWSDPNGAWG